jgi:hypothetical protein
VGNGKWKNGKMEKWKMENGKWKMENGKWKMENGKWKMENGNKLDACCKTKKPSFIFPS